MSLIGNERGFSLPEIIIALGLMGGISLVTMKLMDEQRSNQTYIRGRSEISKAIGLIKNTLNKPINCRQNFAGVNLTTPGTVDMPDIKIHFERGGTNYTQALLVKNKRYPDFKVESILLTRAAGAIPGMAELVMNFRIKSRNFKLWGAAEQDDPDDRIITERLSMIVEMTGNVITDCSPALSETNLIAKRKFCESLGAAATWNTTTQKCVYNDMRCPFGQIVTNMDKVGGGTCTRIEQTIDLNSLFSQQACDWTGTVKIVNVMGKLQVQCN